MKNPYALIFFGFLAILMGFGDNEAEIIPSEIKFITGFAIIIYAIFLLYRSNFKNKINNEEVKKKFNAKNSYIYLALGALLLKSPKLIFPNHYLELNFIIISLYLLGFGFLIFGLNLFLKEKRRKKESGSIE